MKVLMPEDSEPRLRRLPKVGDVLAGRVGQALLQTAPRWAVVAAVREDIARQRAVLRTQEAASAVLPRYDIDEARVRAAIAQKTRVSLRRVLNATGVVLHTNLGRAPLAESALQRVVEVARGYSNLEFRTDEKARGHRHDHVAQVLRELTSAEASVVVNNCAGAVLLALGALAHGGKAIVSRGELVEIGGGFRVPEIMAASGATLVEVGTTNRTRVSDFRRASDEAGGDLRVLMRVHRSNFATIGFTEEPTVAELAELAQEKQVPLFVDLGAGAIFPVPGGDEPTVRELVEAGADLIAFSGDKLLGGPQSGILVGRRDLIDRIAKHPLMRALRPDKLSLAALEATLALYRDQRDGEVPVRRMLTVPEPTLESRARRLAEQLAQICPQGAFMPVRVKSAVGGGASPAHQPWSWAVAVGFCGCSEQTLDESLREATVPVVGRIAQGQLLLDVRTLAESELDEVIRTFAEVGAQLSPQGG
jgi:L-seryl-tRNA(Ser) seleniumtransferase